MKQVIKSSTKDYVVQMIREDIFSGNLKPGEELVQEVLAEQLNVSRMPVREALQALVQEGVARYLPNRHIQVALQTEGQLLQTFQVIAAMETEMELLLDSEQIRQLIFLAERWCNALNDTDLSKIRTEEYSFHQGVYTQLGNPYLGQILKKMLEGYVLFAIKRTVREQQMLVTQANQIRKSLLKKESLLLKKTNTSYFEDMAHALVRFQRHSKNLTD